MRHEGTCLYICSELRGQRGETIKHRHQEIVIRHKTKTGTERVATCETISTIVTQHTHGDRLITCRTKPRDTQKGCAMKGREAWGTGQTGDKISRSRIKLVCCTKSLDHYKLGRTHTGFRWTRLDDKMKKRNTTTQPRRHLKSQSTDDHCVCMCLCWSDKKILDEREGRVVRI